MLFVLSAQIAVVSGERTVLTFWQKPGNDINVKHPTVKNSTLLVTDELVRFRETTKLRESAHPSTL